MVNNNRDIFNLKYKESIEGIMYITLSQSMYDAVIKTIGPNGGYDPSKVKLVVTPLFK